MSRYNVRDNFKDIFGVYLLHSLSFEGDYDMIVTECKEDISKIDYPIFRAFCGNLNF